MKTIDVHAHCLIPAASKLLGEDAYKHHTGGIVMEDATTRLRDMDAQGIDMEALSINPFWYRGRSRYRRGSRASQQRRARRDLRA